MPLARLALLARALRQGRSGLGDRACRAVRDRVRTRGRAARGRARAAGRVPPFIAVLFALFTIAGGICVRGHFRATPALNTGSASARGHACQPDGHNRRVNAADPAAAEGERRPPVSRSCGRVLHPDRRQRRRSAVAARRSAAVHRLPQRRRLLLADTRAAVADRRSSRRRCSRSSTSSTPSVPARARSGSRAITTRSGRARGPANFVLLAAVVGAVLVSGLWKPGITLNVLGMPLALAERRARRAR